MARLVEFIGNHLVLVGSFLSLLFALIVVESRRGGQSLSSQALVNLVNRQQAAVIDLRSADDYRAGHITGSINIPYAELTTRKGELEKFRGVPVVLVCAMGQHAGSVGRQLRSMGFASIYRLAGGIGSWQADKLPLVKGK